jgi:hypothetical protein
MLLRVPTELISTQKTEIFLGAEKWSYPPLSFGVFDRDAPIPIPILGLELIGIGIGISRNWNWCMPSF